MRLFEIKIYNRLDNAYRTILAAHSREDHNALLMMNHSDVQDLLDSTDFDPEYDEVVGISKPRISNLSTDSGLFEQVRDNIQNLTK
jgi:hypothetical protein